VDLQVGASKIKNPTIPELLKNNTEKRAVCTLNSKGKKLTSGVQIVRGGKIIKIKLGKIIFHGCTTPFLSK